MTTRIDVIDILTASLLRIDGRTSPWDSAYTFRYSVADVFSEFRFFDDVNAFPTIMFTVTEEAVRHIGANVRYSDLEIELRAYTYDEEVQNSGEALAEDVEHVLQYVRSMDPRLEEVRLLDIETDAGLNEPYGSVIMKIQVLFQR